MIEDHVDNALVAMKDQILQRINEIREILPLRERIVEALDLTNKVAFVLPLWSACDYGYKAAEIGERLVEISRDLAESLDARATQTRRLNQELYNAASSLMYKGKARAEIGG